MKMKERNQQLKETLNRIPTKETIQNIHNVPNYDTKNREGHGAYSIDDKLRLLSMLNTLKLQPQFYRTEEETLTELRDLIEKIALKDPYFVAQAIVYSRCERDGMRTINHVAAALLAPFASGTSWGKSFYSNRIKGKNKGGCIYRLDDMSEIKDAFSTLSHSTLSNAMKKGFAKVLENTDTYQLVKYKKTTIDITNLVHPNISECKGEVIIGEEKFKTIDALMRGFSTAADTWETANSEAGKLVSEAVKEGTLSEREAEELLSKAKLDNYKSLIMENKMGVLALLRNLRNIDSLNPSFSLVNKICSIVSDTDKLIKGKIMPYQLDYAWEHCKNDRIRKALERGLESCVDNLKEILNGRNLIILDCSGSMRKRICSSNLYSVTSCMDKAALIAAMICKTGKAHLVRFGSYALRTKIDLNQSVFKLAEMIASDNMGCTNLASAFNLIRREKLKYERIFILSDDECNQGNQVGAYKNYLREVGDPYIYSVDLAAYGTMPLKNEGKINYYYGYGYSLFDDIINKEFDPEAHIEEVRKIII